MSEQTMRTGVGAGATERVVPEKIIVALDSSPCSLAALRAAAQLAALFGAELEGVFVEDINLIHLCGFPFGREIGSYTAVPRPLDEDSLCCQLRAVAGAIEDAMQAVAGPTQVRWSFRVVRGSVVSTLLDVSQGALVLSLGRASVRQRRSLGSTAQTIVRQSSRPLFILGETGMIAAPLVLLYSGTTASEQALRLAIEVAGRADIELRIVVVDAADAGKAVSLQDSVEQMVVGEAVDVRVENRVMSNRGQKAQLSDLEVGGGTLIVPGDYAGLLAEHDGPTILVP